MAADDLSLPWQVVRLTWWAVCRDSVYYTLSVVVLIAVSHPQNTPSIGWSGPCEGTGACLSVLDPMTREVTAATVECVDPSLCSHGPLTPLPTPLPTLHLPF